MALAVESLADRIFAHIRDQIISGDIPAGTALRQDSVAALFGVSKIPLRQAMARLEQAGLLVAHANRGFFVPPLSASEIEEVYDLRLKLEPDIIAIAAQSASDVQRLRAANALLALQALDTKDVAQLGRAQRNFHVSLITPANKPMTADVLTCLHLVSERYVCRYLDPVLYLAQTRHDYTALLALWSQGKAKEAACALHDHISANLFNLRIRMQYRHV